MFSRNRSVLRSLVGVAIAMVLAPAPAAAFDAAFWQRLFLDMTTGFEALAPALAPQNIDNTAIVLGEALNEVAPIADDPIDFVNDTASGVIDGALEVAPPLIEAVPLPEEITVGTLDEAADDLLDAFVEGVEPIATVFEDTFSEENVNSALEEIESVLVEPITEAFSEENLDDTVQVLTDTMVEPIATVFEDTFSEENVNSALEEIESVLVEPITEAFSEENLDDTVQVLTDTMAPVVEIFEETIPSVFESVMNFFEEDVANFIESELPAALGGDALAETVDDLVHETVLSPEVESFVENVLPAAIGAPAEGLSGALAEAFGQVEEEVAEAEALE